MKEIKKEGRGYSFVHSLLQFLEIDSFLVFDFVQCQSFKLVGEDQPSVGIVNPEIRFEVLHIARWFVVHGGDLDSLGKVLSTLAFELGKHGLYASATVENIIDNQQLVVGIDVRDDVLQAMDTYLFLLFFANIRGCSDGNVIGLNAMVHQNLLHRYPRERASTPNTHNESRLKSILHNLEAESHRALQELLCSNEVFVSHLCEKVQKEEE